MKIRNGFVSNLNECEISGERVMYDGCSSSTLEKGKKFYEKYGWIYIGSGHKTWQLHHFFIKPHRKTEIRLFKIKKLNEYKNL